MTIKEAIEKTNARLPGNGFSEEDMINWLSQLDMRIKVQIMDAHVGEPVLFYGYDADTDTETELLACAPYDEMYLRWLEAMIHYHDSEDERYNNAIILFDNAYEGYKKYYTRTHMPKSCGGRFVT